MRIKEKTQTIRLIPLLPSPLSFAQFLQQTPSYFFCACYGSTPMAKTLTINWGEADKAPEQRKKWLGAWLVSRDGEEGEYFYDGPGGGQTTHDIPVEVVGLRLRWWPPDNQV